MSSIHSEGEMELLQEGVSLEEYREWKESTLRSQNYLCTILVRGTWQGELLRLEERDRLATCPGSLSTDAS